MKITVYGKKKTASDGKSFAAFIARLTRKDGSTLSASVKFRDECGQPKLDECPINIEFDKKDANLSDRIYIREDTGEEATSYTLWISAWQRSKDIFVDHSLDDFE